MPQQHQLDMQHDRDQGNSSPNEVLRERHLARLKHSSRERRDRSSPVCGLRDSSERPLPDVVAAAPVQKVRAPAGRSHMVPGAINAICNHPCQCASLVRSWKHCCLSALAAQATQPPDRPCAGRCYHYSMAARAVQRLHSGWLNFAPVPTMIAQPSSLPPVPAARAVTASLYTVIGMPAGNLAWISVATSSPSAAQDMPASPRQIALTSVAKQQEACSAWSMARRSDARASTRPELFLFDRGNHRRWQR